MMDSKGHTPDPLCRKQYQYPPLLLITPDGPDTPGGANSLKHYQGMLTAPRVVTPVQKAHMSTSNMYEIFLN